MVVVGSSMVLVMRGNEAGVIDSSAVNGRSVHVEVE